MLFGEDRSRFLVAGVTAVLALCVTGCGRTQSALTPRLDVTEVMDDEAAEQQVNNQIDAAYATTVSGPARKLEASPRGIRWPAVKQDDQGCWQRMRAIAPYFRSHVATRGAGISAQRPHEGATYPYPLLIALPDTNVDLVAALTAAIHQHYDDYKRSDPGSIGWAMDRQVLRWEVPYHEGAIRYLRSIGVWDAAAAQHNDRKLARQAVLASAWSKHLRVSKDDSDDRFRTRWHSARALALRAAGFDPIWD